MAPGPLPCFLRGCTNNRHQTNTKPAPNQYRTAPNQYQTAPNQYQTGTESMPNRHRINAEPTPNQCRTDTESMPNRHQTDTKPMPNRLAGSAAAAALYNITQNRRVFVNLIGRGLFFLKKPAVCFKKLRLTV